MPWKRWPYCCKQGNPTRCVYWVLMFCMQAFAASKALLFVGAICIAWAAYHCGRLSIHSMLSSAGAGSRIERRKRFQPTRIASACYSLVPPFGYPCRWSFGLCPALAMRAPWCVLVQSRSNPADCPHLQQVTGTHLFSRGVAWREEACPLVAVLVLARVGFWSIGTSTGTMRRRDSR